MRNRWWLRSTDIDSVLRSYGFAPDGGGAGGDGSGGSGTGGSSGQQDVPPGDGKAKIELTTEQLADRLERARKQGEAAAADRQRHENDEALGTQRRFEDLANARQETIVQLQAEVKNLKEQVETVQKKADEYEAALQSRVDDDLKDVPEHLKPLLMKMSPVEQIEYLGKHKTELTAPRNTPVPPNPPADGGAAGEQGDAFSEYMKRTYGSVTVKSQ